LFILCLLFFFSCTPERITPPVETEKGFLSGVFITNEGGFTHGNASVTFYDPIEKIVQEKIFETVNNQSLGDVLQSMTIIEDKAYLVLNNSQKVEVVNLNNFTSLGTIEDLISPRYLTPINETTAYVSDIYGAAISVVDLTTQQEMTKIPFGSASEEMIKIGNEMFVAQPSLSINTKKSSNQIFVINTLTNQVTDSIQIGYNPSELQLDSNNKLWAICNGEQNFGNSDKLGGIYRINPLTKEVEAAFPFSNSPVSFAPRLVMNSAKNKLYFLKVDVFELSINATVLPDTPIIPANGRDIYGLGVNPTNDNIYIGESGNYQQRGTVTIYDSTGNELNSFKAGVAISGFYFN
ncbi:MAG: YncE family protein, partial [Saprospiraceae bacterium]